MLDTISTGPWPTETCVLLAAANADTESYLAKNGQILVVAAAGPTNSQVLRARLKPSPLRAFCSDPDQIQYGDTE
jgi:hypothetical protein